MSLNMTLTQEHRDFFNKPVQDYKDGFCMKSRLRAFKAHFGYPTYEVADLARQWIMETV